MIKVSVCIVTYNHQDYISECISSVLEQNVDFQFEIIIAQDCSTDNTGSIVRDLQCRFPKIITLIDREVNVGVMQNYEDVFKQARGEYISFLDGDDYMLPNKLKFQVDALDKYSDCNIVSHPLSNFDSGTGIILSTPHKFDENKFYTINNLIINGFLFSHSSKMFRRNSLPTEIVDKKTKNCTDYLLHMQNCLNGNIIHLNKVLGMHRVHSNSLSRFNLKKGNIGLALDDQIYALDKISTMITIESKVINKGYERILLWGFKKAIFANDYNEINRIKNIWNNKIPKNKIPNIYIIMVKYNIGVYFISFCYENAYYLRNKFRLRKYA